MRTAPGLLFVLAALFLSAPDGRAAEPATASAVSVARDQHGRIARSTAAKNAFKKAQPCPVTGQPRGPCPGYIIDHVIALKRGGPDTPTNMQWQTKADAKAKDRVE